MDHPQDNLADVVQKSIKDEDNLKTLMGMIGVKSTRKSVELEDQMVAADYAANHNRVNGDTKMATPGSAAALGDLPMDIMSAGNVRIIFNEKADPAPPAPVTPPAAPAASPIAALATPSTLSTLAKIAAVGLAATGVGTPIALALPSIVDILTKNTPAVVQPADPTPQGPGPVLPPERIETDHDWRLGIPILE